MSKQVWKYALSSVTELRLPPGSTVRHVACQGNNVCIWIEVDCHSSELSVRRVFEVVGTGRDIPQNGKFVGSVLTERGEYVFHVYEVTKS